MEYAEFKSMHRIAISKPKKNKKSAWDLVPKKV